ncbi:MAG: hypothetical protein JWL81_1234 [Verrucomicrobiales bacterium]|nr:hypothetical protein [Verrucomicrobiales bacterium]
MPAASATDPAPSLDTMDLSLRAVLRDADAGSLGFAPENVPENVRVTLPLELVTQQLATGRVEIGVDDIRLGISEKFRPAFARADEGLRVVVPMSEVFHNLPESAKPALQPVAAPYDHLSITTSPFQTPFAIKAEEDRTKQLLDLSATGFDSPGRSARPATRPVPLPELPPAPLPPVHRMEGGPPAVNVELPPLRPAASASPVAAIAPVNAAAALPNLPSLPLSPATLQELPGSASMQPRPGMLSRPPVTGAQPGQASLPKLAPRVKAVPASATALKAFPKPQAPPPAAPEFLATAPLPVLPIAGPTALPVEPISPAVEPIAPAAPAIAADSATPATSPTPASFPPSAPSFIHESSDDLGESFSAATLSAEPPPRAGSAPVGPPASFVQPPPSLTPLFRTALTPVAEAPLSPPAIRELPSLSENVPANTGADGTPSDRETPPTPPSTTATEWLTGAVPQLESSVAFPSQAASVMEAPVRISSPDFVAEAPTLPIADVEFNAPLARPEATPEARPGPTQAASPVEDLSFGYNTDSKQLLLRAVLGTDRTLTEQDIVNLCADLPGLKSCVLFRNESVWINQGTEAMAANTFRAAAERTRDSLADLAETMGLGSGGNFTLRSDLGVRSFFLESGLCLAVWHEQASFVGGTREKLILIAQELAKS